MDWNLFFGYLVVINLIAFAICGMDKWKACKGKWRTPEVRLLLVAILGGSLGVWSSMYIFHHKTQCFKFEYGVPAIMILQLVLTVYLWYIYPI